MKIGIMTFWWSEDNYGQLLQCYALQKYLRNMGHDAFLIRYKTTADYIKASSVSTILKSISFNMIIKVFKTIYNYMFSNVNKRNRMRRFSDFLHNNIKLSSNYYSTYSELITNPPDADMYIAGSDQVWSFIINPLHSNINIANAFFLNFGSSKTKRVSYAASWGGIKITNEYKLFISPLIEKFSFVGIREQSGYSLCEECGYKNAIVTPDPTLLFDSSFYRALYSQATVSGSINKYILLYILDNGFRFDLTKVYRYARQIGLDVVLVSGNGYISKNKMSYPTIEEWLFLVDKAEYVITNSYHCCIFSIIFNKKFGIIPLTNRLQSLNSRFSTLFDLFKIEERFIFDDFQKVLNSPYKANINDVMKDARSKVEDMLLA